MVKLSKKYVDPTGGKMIDEIVSSVPIFSKALDNDDMATVHHILCHHQENMKGLAPHITHDQYREPAAEAIDAFHSLIACMKQGKCGYLAYYHYLCSCINTLSVVYKISDNIE